MQFTDQTAIVTGGCSGIGRAIARRLQALGARVHVFDSDPKGASVVAEGLGSGAGFHCVDITQGAQVEAAAREVRRQSGGIDVLVNSAGITGRTNLKTHEVDPADFIKVFQVNALGSFLAAKAVLPHMLERRYGRILLIASISGKEGNAGMLAYSASKAAVIGMAKVMGKEYAETGVTINAIAPAVVQTPMVDAMPAAQVEYMTAKIPMKRCCTLEEIAEMAAFIVSRENSFTTGFTFDLTGGRAVY
jgi:NAD(P)-dependent dehydrogenase (short-subunit alcohol dehydrogenase family)